ncbi:uncharacterized protein HD556DRAFT_911599 [Suillus plorans]|uniref:Uncharacterized protein n=1 Tax=Suillus plorans TaxID=116603 RepID=A0A9P7AH93_9AGAM|nr:uncharacterized protein HD556DRAFT_911599 [Suillus plorans]KAG1788261.1 hypothetical protein HD556DRAFT_911599 [Suillus plorans]
MHPSSPRVLNIIQQSCRIKSFTQFIYTCRRKCARSFTITRQRISSFLFCTFLLVSFCGVLFIFLLVCLFYPRDSPHPAPMTTTGPFVLVLRSLVLEFFHFILFVRLLFD